MSKSIYTSLSDSGRADIRFWLSNSKYTLLFDSGRAYIHPCLTQVRMSSALGSQSLVHMGRRWRILCTPPSGVVHMGCNLCQVFSGLTVNIFEWLGKSRYAYLHDSERACVHTLIVCIRKGTYTYLYDSGSSSTCVLLLVRLRQSRYKAGDWDCVAAKERLPALHYSVDFIFLSFGIMGFIVELWSY